MKKKITYVVHSLNPGGTERLAVDMGIHFNQEYDIFIVCLDEPGKWAGQARQAGVPVYSFYRQSGLDLRIPFKLAQFAQQHKIDLFHAHQCTPWFYAGLARILYPKIKLLLEEHGRHYPEILSKKRKFFNKFFLQYLTTKSVAVSKDVKKRLVAYEGIHPDKIKIIYNGVKSIAQCSPEKKENLRKHFGFKRNELILGTIGRLDPIKNLPLFIEGFHKLKPRFPQLKGIIIGDGPMMHEVKDRLKALNLENEIVLTGFRSDAAELVNIIDIFALLSFSEGTSMALLESMAAGIPSIVTKVGGNPEIVIDQKTGWVIPSNDLTAFTDVLQYALENPDKRTSTGISAQQRFADNFTFEKMIEQYTDIYKTLIRS